MAVTFDRPENLNAINPEVYAAFEDALNEFAESDARVAVLFGEGSKAFIAGADISDYLESDAEAYIRLMNDGHRIMRRMRDVPKPIVLLCKATPLGVGLRLRSQVT